MGEKKEWKWNLVPTRDTCQAGPWRLPRTGRAAPRPRRGRGRGPGCAAAPQAAPRHPPTPVRLGVPAPARASHKVQQRNTIQTKAM